MAIAIVFPTTVVQVPVGTPIGTRIYSDSDLTNGLPSVTHYVDKIVDTTFSISCTGDMANDLVSYVKGIRFNDVQTDNPINSTDNYITTGKDAWLRVQITDGCCGDTVENILFDGYIDIDTLNYCTDECTASFVLEDSQAKGNIIRCLKANTFRQQSARAILYETAGRLDNSTSLTDALDITMFSHCVNAKPDSLQFFLLLLLTIMTPVLLSLQLTVLVLGAVLLVIAAIIGILLIPFTGLNGYINNLTSLASDIGDVLSLFSQFKDSVKFCNKKDRPVGIKIKQYLNTICTICNIPEDFFTDFLYFEQEVAPIQEFYITKQGVKRQRDIRDIDGSGDVFNNYQIVSVHNVVDMTFFEFLESLDTTFALRTRLAKASGNDLGIQVSHTRGIFKWQDISTGTPNLINLETDNYANTTANDNRYQRIKFCVDARDEAYPAGYLLRWAEDFKDSIGDNAKRFIYDEEVLWGSVVNTSLNEGENGFRGLNEISIPYAAAASGGMGGRISLYDTDAYAFLVGGTVSALITGQATFDKPKIVDGFPVSLTEYDDIITTSIVVAENRRVLFVTKLFNFLKHGMFKDEALDLINSLGSIDITDPLQNDALVFALTGEFLSNTSLEDNVFCEVPLYTGSIVIEQANCELTRYFRELSLQRFIPMFVFPDLGQFSTRQISINYSDRTITLTGEVYSSRVPLT